MVCMFTTQLLLLLIVLSHRTMSSIFGRSLQVTVRYMLRDHFPVCPVCNVGVLWLNGWTDEDAATWYGGRPRPRRHCVRWGPISPPPPKGPCLLWPNDCPSQQLLSSCLCSLKKTAWWMDRSGFHICGTFCVRSLRVFCISAINSILPWKHCCRCRRNVVYIENSRCCVLRLHLATATSSRLLWRSSCKQLAAGTAATAQFVPTSSVLRAIFPLNLVQLGPLVAGWATARRAHLLCLVIKYCCLPYRFSASKLIFLLLP